MLIEPLPRRDSIERHHLGVIRSGRGRNGERTSSLPVAPGYPAIDLGFEFAQLAQVVMRCPGDEIEPFEPAAGIKDALFGITAEILLADHRIAAGVGSFD